MKYLFLIFTGIFLTTTLFSQKETRLLREGNRNYQQGNFQEAEKDYRKALQLDSTSVKGNFNLGAAVYQEKNFEESAKLYAGLTDRNLKSHEKANVFHNLGNSLLEARQYEKSIEAYKQALLNEPDDMDSKYNLEYAKMMLKQQQQQQQQNQDQQKQDQKDQDKQDQQQQDQQDQQNQDQQQQQQQQRPDKISKEDAERMLEALKNDEKKTMEKVKKQKVNVQVAGIEKDW